jgi:hypothetical protein
MATLALAALVDSATVDWRALDLRHSAPLGAIVLLQTILSVRQGASWRMMIVAALAIPAGCWAARHAPLVQNGYAPVHLFLLAALAIGLTFDDRLARSLRRAAAYLLPALALLAVGAYPLLFPRTPLAMHALYTAALAVLAALVWRREQQTEHLAGVLTTAAALAATMLQAGYAQLNNTPLAAGREWLAAGLACLGVGLLISLAKGGVLRSGWNNLAAWNRRLQSQPPT